MAPGRCLPVLGVVVFAGACAGPGVSLRQPLEPQEWRSEVRLRGLDPSGLDNPLSFTDEMQREALQAAGEGRNRERLSRLHAYLFECSESFDYETFTTATAAEAFEHRTGNCVSITSLFIAMSRSLDIHVMPALLRVRGEAEKDGDLMLVKNHIVALWYDEGTALIYDFYETREAPPISIRPIDDLWLAAIYQSNRGVQALREGDLERAEESFEVAIRLAPAYAAVYGNLAVVRRRRGDSHGALDACLVALQIEPKNESLRSNLFSLVPDLARREVRKACKHYRRAQREGSGRPDALVNLARCELARGRVNAARKRLEQADAASAGNADVQRLLDSLARLEAPPPEWPIDRID